MENEQDSNSNIIKEDQDVPDVIHENEEDECAFKDKNNKDKDPKKGKRGNRKSARHGSRNQHRHKSL
eukprot:5566153-Ditylum_brightwellii.AAC.1